MYWMYWTDECLELLAEELSDDTQRATSQLLGCGKDIVASLLSAIKKPGQDTHNYNEALESLIDMAYEKMSSGVAGSCWPRLYTDACIIRSLVPLDTSSSRAAIARLDRAIIVAGAAGEGRLDLIHTLIRRIQFEFLTFTQDLSRRFSKPRVGTTLDPRLSNFALESSLRDIPALDTPPSFTTFQTTYNRHPFVLHRFASAWPAMNEHPWSSAAYLRSVSGPARIVPVEVGADYRSDDWTQQFMSWDDFLSNLGLDDNESPAYADNLTEREARANQVLYLAQHSLLLQFPDLSRDIVIPDYVYTCPTAPSNYPRYEPPGNDEQLVINAWLGPRGTTSPAHTDPYYNIYVQVVGRKTVWLAPPSVNQYMYVYKDGDAPPTRKSSNPSTKDDNSTSMSNTSQVDVLATGKDAERFAQFWSEVVPHAMSAMLEPGDMLFIPPGWWHAMRAEETSFSVSMWF
ncbi:hypothetical protein F5878DRAFT_641597 [Lentinula raphanica]|uniref:JmjC domain-containing protein n=1 Tax=Lentinula raphanica TaxID=153919 RepID=A0AA38PA87_9AGAR|nr:hypothetical protein F5880DRAFT_1551886 [Lentinula raphanica]KAJ3838911.1 hypothetical protein F5878DRAFT_641597 [Lentinula raphanica]